MVLDSANKLGIPVNINDDKKRTSASLSTRKIMTLDLPRNTKSQFALEKSSDSSKASIDLSIEIEKKELPKGLTSMLKS
jgi:hypothetical protein